MNKKDRLYIIDAATQRAVNDNRFSDTLYLSHWIVRISDLIIFKDDKLDYADFLYLVESSFIRLINEGRQPVARLAGWALELSRMLSDSETDCNELAKGAINSSLIIPSWCKKGLCSFFEGLRMNT